MYTHLKFDALPTDAKVGEANLFAYLVELFGQAHKDEKAKHELFSHITVNVANQIANACAEHRLFGVLEVNPSLGAKDVGILIDMNFWGHDPVTFQTSLFEAMVKAIHGQPYEVALHNGGAILALELLGLAPTSETQPTQPDDAGTLIRTAREKLEEAFMLQPNDMPQIPNEIAKIPSAYPHPENREYWRLRTAIRNAMLRAGLSKGAADLPVMFNEAAEHQSLSKLTEDLALVFADNVPDDMRAELETALIAIDALREHNANQKRTIEEMQARQAELLAEIETRTRSTGKAKRKGKQETPANDSEKNAA